MPPEFDSKPVFRAMKPWRRASGVLALSLVGALTGCDDKKSTPEPAPAPAPSAPAPAPAPQPTTVTVLVTGSVNGQLAPAPSEDGKTPPAPRSCSAGGRPRRSTVPARSRRAGPPVRTPPRWH
ncbi:hypothetical protein ACN28S_15430 [Cystobacter fuscus]